MPPDSHVHTADGSICPGRGQWKVERNAVYAEQFKSAINIRLKMFTGVRVVRRFNHGAAIRGKKNVHKLLSLLIGKGQVSLCLLAWD